MALSTYTELQATIAAYLGRSDLTSVIVDAIRQVEAVLNYGGKGVRALRVRQMERRSTSSLTAGNEAQALPTDFLSARSLRLNGNPRIKLDYITPEQADTWFQTTTTDVPEKYTIVGGEFIILPPADQAYTAQLIYYFPIPPLASNSTNWLLTASPHVYLYGALAELRRYARNPSMDNVDYATVFANDVAMLNDQDKEARVAGVMQMRPLVVV